MVFPRAHASSAHRTESRTQSHPLHTREDTTMFDNAPKAFAWRLSLCGMIAVFASGCLVSRTELEECTTRVAALDAENARMEKDLEALRSDYKEVLRDFGVQTPAGQEITAEYMADVRQQLDIMRQAVQEEVPDQVRENLTRELDSLLSMLDTQYAELDAQYSRISGRLEQVTTSLEVANSRLEGIETTGTDIQQELVAQRVDEDRLETELNDLADMIDGFDDTRFLCGKECPEHLGIRPKRAEGVLSFHAEIRSILRRLPLQLTRPADDDEMPSEDGEEAPEEPEEVAR